MRILVIIFLLLVTYGYAQIETIKINKPIIEESTYDGSKNFVAEKANFYLGEDLYLIGKSQSLQKWGYSDFYESLKSSNPYKCCSESSPYNSNYDLLFGKYFSVIDVIPNDLTQKYPSIYSEYFFKLLEKETMDTLYYKYNGKFEHNFPFIVLKHFNYIKDKHINKTYIFGTTFLRDNFDLNQNKLKPKIGEKWIVEDLIIEEENFKLVFVISNSSGIKTIVDYSVFEYNDINKPVLSLSEYNKYKNKFGEKNWNLIFEEGEIRIGFTEEMCRFAWGEPLKINKASYGDQWVYDDNYLYFKNGKLTGYN
ncbi:hypothetical protein [Faecalibacter rhinopitheci]|uniref:Uncharacterized protein n=1 Tax=Faecalibacter rhinopitheci TaxID=2779678 RepID=A0A8J7FXB2_9FLAO|nr:hypothetical protein [Faecalibacter rhinopitheci]MBF0597348.1 hypothetical protein [Faecalibacter rhinopitheci]